MPKFSDIKIPDKIADAALKVPGNYKVILSSVGNPDYGQDPNRPLFCVRSRIAKAISIEHASQICKKFISENELGNGNWSGGQVKLDGLVVAQISYNGKAWSVEATPTSPQDAALISAFKPSFPNPEVWTDDLIVRRQAEFEAFNRTPEGIAEEKAFDEASSEKTNDDHHSVSRSAYIELVKNDELAKRTLLSTYADSHSREDDESDDDYLWRCAEQDFEDGPHGCLFPDHYETATTVQQQKQKIERPIG